MKRWGVAPFVVGAVLVGLLAGMSPAQAYEDWQDWNDYVVSDLPEFIVAPTPFTVTVDGPLPVCSMSYDGTTLTAAPWTFTAPLTKSNAAVDITLCDGSQDSVRVWTSPAFEFGGKYLVPGKQTKRGTQYAISVANNLDQPAAITVLSTQGKVLATGSAEAGSYGGAFGAPTMMFNPGKLKRTTTFIVRVTAPDGTSSESAVVAPVGWSLSMGAPTDINCSVIRWYYNKKGQPSHAKAITKDIVTALAKLSAQTGLTFARTSNPDEATLTYLWDDLGVDGPSGVGTMSSDSNETVTFNTKDWWPLDSYGGSGRIKGFTPGRVWLIVHETMHTLGMGHVNDRTQVMNPVGYMASFGKGDLAGLHTLYPKAACRA